MTRKTTRIVCIVLAALLLFGIVSYALSLLVFGVTQAEIDVLEAERDIIKAQQADIQEQIDLLQAEKASVAERKAALDEQTALNVQNIDLIDRQIAIYDQMIEDKGVEVEQAIAAQELQYDRYKTRVRAMEETNTWTYMSILLKATSLTDFLSRLSDVEDIVRSDKNVKVEYEAARAHTEQVLSEYEAIQAEQLIKREELLVEKTRLEEQVEQATALILQLEDDIEAYEEAFDEKEAERDDIQARIDQMVADLKAQQEAERKAREAYEAALRAQQLQQQQQQNSGGTTASAADAGYFSWPTYTTYITSGFGYRVHPIFGTTKYHAGLDIASALGTTITAAAGGTVQISEYSSSYGNYCVIYHSNGMTTLYAHMNSLPIVSVGETVTAGQAIGYVGSTGWSTGPHLHFEIRVNGSCVDPTGYFPSLSFTYAADA